MKRIIFSALALAAVSMAGAQTTRNLVVTDKEGNDTNIPTDQIQAVVFSEAPNYAPLTHFLGATYEESGGNGIYTVELANATPDASGDPAHIGDIQLRMVLTGPKSANLNQPLLPAGYYRAGNGEYTFSVAKSAIWTLGDEGVTPIVIIDGTIDVRESAGNYDIRCELTTMAGELNLRYQGTVDISAGYGEFEKFTEPVELTFTHAQGRFWGNWFCPFAADGQVQFIVGNIQGDQFMDGYVLTVAYNEPKPEDCMAPDQPIADGVYKIDSREKPGNYVLPFTVLPGKLVDFWGDFIPTDTRLEFSDPEGHRKLGLIKSGTMTVSGNGTNFVFEFVTEDGISVKGTYSGKPLIGNYCDNDEKEPQRPYSSLKENVTLEWEPSTVAVYYDLGHIYSEDLNAVTLYVTDLKQEKGDFLQFDVFMDGTQIIDGTYTVSKEFAPFHVYPGCVDFGGTLIFAAYGDLSTMDAQGYVDVMAPIDSGTFTVSTLGDGQHKLVFDLKDDNGHTIKGEYVGALFDGNSAAETAPRKLKIKK